MGILHRLCKHDLETPNILKEDLASQHFTISVVSCVLFLVELDRLSAVAGKASKNGRRNPDQAKGCPSNSGSCHVAGADNPSAAKQDSCSKRHRRYWL